jgi:hypothetical protein
MHLEAVLILRDGASRRFAEAFFEGVAVPLDVGLKPSNKDLLCFNRGVAP